MMIRKGMTIVSKNGSFEVIGVWWLGNKQIRFELKNLQSGDYTEVLNDYLQDKLSLGEIQVK